MDCGFIDHRKMVQRNRRGGRFFGRRVNLEYVPLLPAKTVRRVLNAAITAPSTGTVVRCSTFATPLFAAAG
jgi:hypothetical protein